MRGGDIQKMVAVGLIWGSTNALIRRGALLYDHHKNKNHQNPQNQKTENQLLHEKVISMLTNAVSLLVFWQYSVPFLINLSASAAFFALLGDSPISLAVPITNSTTFAATAVFGIILGEQTRLGFAALGTAFIVAGVWLCTK